MHYISVISFLFLFQIGLKYEPNPVPKSRHKFTVIAHRGDHTINPENTLKAYEQAIKDGADYVEIDLRTTSDGHLVSLHDATVNRMTGGTGSIRDLTLEQVESLKVIARSKTDTITYRIPTFEQILKLCKDKIHIYIDFKEADVTPVYNLLKQYNMEQQAIVYINKPAQFTDWRKVAPKMPLMISLPDSIKNTQMMWKFLNQTRPDLLDGNYESYTKDMIAFGRDFDFPIWPDAQSMLEGQLVWDKTAEVRLRGLQTDNPPALIRYLIQKGLR